VLLVDEADGADLLVGAADIDAALGGLVVLDLAV
jgi:hypothetical protein